MYHSRISASSISNYSINRYLASSSQLVESPLEDPTRYSGTFVQETWGLIVVIFTVSPLEFGRDSELHDDPVHYPSCGRSGAQPHSFVEQVLVWIRDRAPASTNQQLINSNSNCNRISFHRYSTVVAQQQY